MNTLKLLTRVKIYSITYIYQALSRYSSRSYCKGAGRVLKKKISSSGLRALFGWPSDLLRTSVGPSSGVLRLLFGCSSGRSRSAVEADSKPSRSVAEHVSNEPRRGPEALPKSTRRRVGALASSDLCLTNFAPTSAIQAVGHQSSSNFPLIFPEGDPKPSRRNSEQRWEKGRSWSGVGRYLNGLFLATKGTVNSPLSYRECTERVPKRYWECTKELPEIYQRGTKQVRAVSSSMVALGYKSDTAVAQPAKGEDTELVNGRGESCFKFNGFKTIYERVVSVIDSFVIDGILMAQRVLKCFAYLFGYKNTFRMSLTCLALVFKSSNFSFKALKSIRALIVLALMVSMFSLSAQTPRKDSGADGLSQIRALAIGDTIPENLWSLKMPVFNDSKGRSTISLSDYQNHKLIILDFWATWCTNCLESFPKLDKLKATFKNDFDVLLVNCKRTHDDQTRIDKVLQKYKDSYQLNVQFPYLVGDTIFNAVFPHRGIPHVVWIGNDRVVKAITYTTELQEANVRQILENNKASFYIKDDFKYKVEDSVTTDTLKLFSSFLSKRREGIREMGVQIKEKGNEKEFTFLNTSVAMRIYEYLSESGHRIDRNLWVFDDNVSKETRRKLKTPQRYTDEYCYFLRYPKDQTNFDPYRKMIHDIQDNFGVRWEIRKEVIDVWRIDSTPKIRQFKTKGQIPLEAIDALNNTKFIRNLPLRNSFNVLSWLLNKPVMLGDIETINVDFDLPADLLDYTDAQLLSLLEKLGAKISMVPVEVEYVYFSADKGV
ncbi:MAG: TlpA family protein disulfide reductase [Sphingobacterium sp.]